MSDYYRYRTEGRHRTAWYRPGEAVPESAERVLVIGAGDMELIERLAEAYNASEDVTCVGGLRDAVRALLDPKPPEPTGLGAVVRTSNGMHWTRANNDGDWFSADGQYERRWEGIDAVAVVAEGVIA